VYNLAANENRARIKLAKLFKFPAHAVEAKRRGEKGRDGWASTKKIVRMHIPQEINREGRRSRAEARAQWREIAI